ncbi:metal-dependent hydrolase [Tessaracoccus sp.]
MGPTHAMSGAAGWLAVVAAADAGVAGPGMGVLVGMPLPVVAMGAAVCAGAALIPDLDCPGSLSLKDGSTVVRAFGIVGEAVGHTMNAVSLLVFNMTRSRHDKTRESGHRLLTHTAVFALGLGVLTSLAVSLPGTFTAGGKAYSTGTALALLIMWAGLHLSLFGLFDKWAKKQRKKYGLVGVMVISGVLTLVTAQALPTGAAGGRFWWLGIAVGFGVAMHDLGDAITRAGVPFLWPVPIHGKRWWEFRLPSPLAIRAGGTFELVALFPALTVVTVWLVLYSVPVSRGAAAAVLGLVGVHVPA